MFVWKVMIAIALIYKGIQISLNDKYVYLIQPIIALILLPLAIYLTITKVFIHFTLSPLILFTIIISSIILGILLQITVPLTTDKKRKLIFMPGKYINLIPTFAVLIISYTLGYLRTTQQDFFLDLTDERQLLLIAFTMIICIVIVMNICICYRYLRSKSTPIIIKKKSHE